MYYRSQGYRYPKNMRIPINYGGNAFSEAENNEPQENTLEVSNSDEAETEAIPEESGIPTASDNLIEESKSAPASLFGNLGSSSFLGGRIGSEELLILALVFLLSDTDSDSDIIWLLLLLLFIK